jgi:hypothetical protein
VILLSKEVVNPEHGRTATWHSLPAAKPIAQDWSEQMKTQKRIAVPVALVVIGLLVLTWPCVRVTKAQGMEPGGAATIGVTATATVKAVDAAKRTVTLQSPDGTTATIRCGADVVNFNQIKVGDVVHATVLDRVVVAVGKSGSPGIAEGLMIARSPKGAKPGVLICETVKLSDKVDSVDAQKHTVTLQGVEGKPQTFKVAPDVDLSAVKPGDEVVVRCTKGLALMVEKPMAEAQPAAIKIKPGEAGVAIEAMTRTATVESIDPAKRMVTLKGSEGETRTIHLGKECINFDQIKVGDQVKATLAEEVAVGVSKAGAPPSADAGVVVARAPAGSKPGMIIAETVDVTAKIDSVDAQARTITLTAADGKSRTIKVGPNVDLSTLTGGDDVTVQCTQALAILVEAR